MWKTLCSFSAEMRRFAYILPSKTAQIHCGAGLLLFLRKPYVPLPQQAELDERERLLEAGRLMQAELERLGLTQEELSADFKAWRQRRQQH
jgi:hypothetical protein